MKLKIKVKAFIGCLIVSLLFATPLLAGVQLSLVDVSDETRGKLKIYVDELLDRNADDSIMFSDVDLVMYKEIFYGPLVQNCTEDLCSYEKDKVDAIIDDNTVRATKAVYAQEVEKGATKDDFATWKEQNTWSQRSDYATLLKDSFQNMVVENEGSTRRLVINVDDVGKITITFDSAGKILGLKYNNVDEHNKYNLEYIITDSDTTIKASESTFYGDLSDSTEDNGGMVTNFEATVTLDPDGNVTNKTGKIYVHNHWLSCRDYRFKLEDDALSSAVNGDYVSIDELSGNGDCVSIDEL
ncbi:MAG: hypothetical protein QS721_09745 [Candidatus Endonucleobacter sp. (ex Gigantidas childressi)]|nr:hypothetical protein [Candidatus Endonucleobacter sp. (ex Gigantidas childressi)]